MRRADAAFRDSVGSALFALCVLALPWADTVSAQSQQWQVIVAEYGQGVAPDLPVGGTATPFEVRRQLVQPLLGDRGSDQFGFKMVSPNASERGFWHWRGSGWRRWLELEATGAVGPGRSGAEAAHVFLDTADISDAGGSDGQRVVRARAGDPAATQNSSWGLWRWTGQSNAEIARGGTDGVLGPGLGANWVFKANESQFAFGRVLTAGQVLLTGTVVSPGNVESTVVARHRPGQGNTPCLRTGSGVPAALSPGLLAGDSFSAFSPSAGFGGFATSPDGRVFAALNVSSSAGLRRAIFALCEGAPVALAASELTAGPLSPAIGEVDARFEQFFYLRTSPVQGVVFGATWRRGNGGILRGIFRNDGSRNLPVAYPEPSGFYGPNWQSSSWTGFNYLSVAHDWTAFSASVATGEGGSATGLWRVQTGSRPQLLALINLTDPTYAPEPGRTWGSFNRFAVLSNGDIVLDANTNPGQTRNLWLLPRGQVPRRLLSIGQALQVPTIAGLATATVQSFTLPGRLFLESEQAAEFSPETGRDGWIADDGQLLIQVTTAPLTFGNILITTRFNLPTPVPGSLFASGFE